MAGHNTTATVQTPVVYERMIPHPLDKWSNISSLTQVATQLPSTIRYQGMLVWVEDKKEFYHFKDGVADNQLVALSTALEGIRTFDTLVNTTANNKLEIKHDLGAANISITFQHNDEMLLVGWKRGKIDGTDKGNYIHLATDVNYVGLRVFIIAKDLAPTQPTHPNLDNELAAITIKLNTTHTNLDTLQEVGDSITALQTTVSSHTTTLTTTHSEYDTFQEIGDKLNSLSENLRDVDTALSVTSTNLVENKAVTLALNTKVTDAPNDTNTYARKGGAWVIVNNITVDAALNGTSTNPVQNQVVKNALDTKIGDAPNNTKVYGRKGTAWVEIQSDLKSPDNYTFALSDTPTTGVMRLHAVKGDNTVISKTLDNAFIGSNPLSKGDGFTNYIEIVGTKLVILYGDRTSSNGYFLIFDDFFVDEFNNTFVFSGVRTISTTQTVTQYTQPSFVNTGDDVYVMFPSTTSHIKRFSAHDFVEVQSFTFPNNTDWNHASHITRNGDYIYFVAGNNNYTGTLRISRIKLDFSAYNKYFDVNQNTNAVGLPGAGMLIHQGFMYLYQTTWNDTNFHMIKIDISDTDNPTLAATVTHNFTQGNSRGLVYGLSLYSNRLFVNVTYIGGATSTTDRQLWSINIDDLSVIEKATVADDSGLFTISPQGKIIWGTLNNNAAGYGDSDAKLLLMNPMDIDGTAPTVLLDVPTTERFSAIAKRVTESDVSRNVVGLPTKKGVLDSGAKFEPTKDGDMTIWIDSTITDSSGAVIGDIDKPYKTLSDAFGDLPTYNGETVHIIFKNGGTHTGTTIPTRNLKFSSDHLVVMDFTGVNLNSSVIQYASSIRADIEFTQNISVLSTSNATQRFTPQLTTTMFVRVKGHMNEFNWVGTGGATSTDYILSSFLSTELKINKVFSVSTNGSYHLGFCNASKIHIVTLQANSSTSKPVMRDPNINSGAESTLMVENYYAIGHAKVSFSGCQVSLKKITSSGSSSGEFAADWINFLDTQGASGVEPNIQNARYVTGRYMYSAEPIKTGWNSNNVTFEDFEGWVGVLGSNGANARYTFKGSNHFYCTNAIINAIGTQTDTLTVENGTTVITQTNTANELFSNAVAANKVIIKGHLNHNSTNLGGITVEWQNNKNRGIPIRNVSGNEQFRTEEFGINLAGDVSFNGATKTVTVGGKIPNTVFVDASGDDATAVVGDYTKPFKTDTAAIAAIPTGNEETQYTMYVLGSSFTFTSTTMPQRNFRIIYNGIGQLDFSSFAGASVGTGNYPLEIFMPRSKFYHNSATTTSAFGSLGRWFKIVMGSAEVLTDSSGTGFFFGSNVNATNQSILLCNGDFEIGANKNYTISVSNVEIRGKLILNGDVIPFGGAKHLNVKVHTIENVTGNNYVLNGNNTGLMKLWVKDITVTAGILYLRRTYTSEVMTHIHFENTTITGAGQVFALDNSNGSANLLITGNVDPSGIGIELRRRGGQAPQTGKVVLKDFTGRIAGTQPLSFIDQQNLELHNCNIFTSGVTFYSTLGTAVGIRLYGVNTITQDTPTDLFSNFTTATTVEKYGKLYSNATAVGANVTINDNTPNTY